MLGSMWLSATQMTARAVFELTEVGAYFYQTEEDSVNNGKNSDAVVLGWQGHLGVHRMPQFGLSVHLWALFLVLLFLEKFRFCTVCIIHHSSTGR